MPNVLLPHHQNQFDGRLQGVRHLLDTGKLPRLDSDEGRARLFGWDREDLFDRVADGFSKVVIVACASIFVASALRIVWVLL